MTAVLNLGRAQAGHATSAEGHISPQTEGHGCPHDNFFSHLEIIVIFIHSKKQVG